jgi:hypothetical protein
MSANMEVDFDASMIDNSVANENVVAPGEAVDQLRTIELPSTLTQNVRTATRVAESITSNIANLNQSIEL